MREVSVRIETAPTAKGRPRFKRMGSFVQTYTPAKTARYEKMIAEKYEAALGSYRFEKEQPIVVSLVFGMPIPASKPKSTRVAMADGIIRHTKKPDLDNLTKAVLDALNGVAWYDDSQIVRISARKRYSEDPYVYIKVYESVD